MVPRIACPIALQYNLHWTGSARSYCARRWVYGEDAGRGRFLHWGLPSPFNRLFVKGWTVVQPVCVQDQQRFLLVSAVLAGRALTLRFHCWIHDPSSHIQGLFFGTILCKSSQSSLCSALDTSRIQSGRRAFIVGADQWSPFLLSKSTSLTPFTPLL